MHENSITERVIGCAIEVHRQLGPGLLESVYEEALCREFEINQIAYKRQLAVPVIYKNKQIGTYKLDLLVESKIILE
ncbi:MAG: GxxExxY protein, partial [Pirellulales bacterium]|nr:GxxExxY protein [Pirellulales bacterium]